MQTAFKDGSVMISGNVGNVEYKTVGQNSIPITKFGVAVGKKPNPDGGDDVTIWVNCNAWRKLADNTKNLQKGDSVLCIGRISTSEHEGKTYKNLDCDFVTTANLPAPTYTAPTPPPPAPDLNLNDFESLNDGDVPF